MTSGKPQGIPFVAPPPSERDSVAPDSAPAGVAELAREFEAVLIAQMLRQMRQALLAEEDQDAGLGGETLTDTVDVELGRALAAQGGVGLASMIERSLAEGVGEGREPHDTRGLHGAGLPSGIVGPSTRPVPPVVIPGDTTGGAIGPRGDREPRPRTPEQVVPGGVPPLTSPLDATVSSGYGWRADPFHGLRRFHAGVDFRAAYGREVPTAGPGRVVFAGEQGGYGQTVVVAHAQGVETRYAHLSAIVVSLGQELASGEAVGRVGQSGRATGPHLHFEVRLDGMPVDPARVAGMLPGALKQAEPDVDSLFERVSRQTSGDRSEP